jgi:hypothetical protein
MINRNQIETILKINGASPSSPDSEIRSVLLSARYNKNEVDSAIMVLRENTITKKTEIQGLHKVFRTDQMLNSGEISSLLGIEIDESTAISTVEKVGSFTVVQAILICTLSIVIAVSGVYIYMYSTQIGLFHPGIV